MMIFFPQQESCCTSKNGSFWTTLYKLDGPVRHTSITAGGWIEFSPLRSCCHYDFHRKCDMLSLNTTWCALLWPPSAEAIRVKVPCV